MGSGLSQQQFCSERGIRYHVFHYWYRRYRSKQKAESFQDSQTQSGFIPVQTLNHSVYFAEIHLTHIAVIPKKIEVFQGFGSF